MRILFTGASSFTGYWMAGELAARGHEITCTFRGSDAGSYGAKRGLRVTAMLARKHVTPLWACTFGDPTMITWIEDHGCDVFCHHGADVGTYRSPDFDWRAAVNNNTQNVEATFEKLATRGCRRIIATGTYFEHDEGGGGTPVEAVSAYGLSKALSWQIQRYFAGRHRMEVGKFVVPTPVGPGEDDRLLSYMVGCWLRGEPARLRAGSYLRDHLPTPLLAQRYARFVEESWLPGSPSYCRPSGWVEKVSAFARRAAFGLTEHLKCRCEVVETPQVEFAEPMERRNTEQMVQDYSSASERDFWAEIASWYLQNQKLKY